MELGTGGPLQVCVCREGGEGPFLTGIKKVAHLRIKKGKKKRERKEGGGGGRKVLVLPDAAALRSVRTCFILAAECVT